MNGENINVIKDFKCSGGTVSLDSGSLSVGGNTDISSGITNLDSGKLIIGGTLTQTGGTINLNKGILDIAHDYIMESETYDQYTDTTHKSNSSGILNMQYAADRVNIGGDFVMHSGYSHNSNIKAGITTLKGNFFQVNGNSSNFAPSGANTVVFAGTEKQKISFESPGSSGFNYVRFDNPKVEITTPIKGWTLQQDTRIDSNIPGFTGTWNLNGHILEILPD